MDLFHNSSGWLGLVLRGSCAVPVGPVEGFVMGRGGCLGQTGWKSLGVCVCLQTCVCVWWTEGKSEGYWEKRYARPPAFLTVHTAYLCNSNKWPDVGLCVCLLRNILEHSPFFSGNMIEMHIHTTPIASNVSETFCFWWFCCPAKYFHWYPRPDLLCE